MVMWAKTYGEVLVDMILNMGMSENGVYSQL